MIIEMILEGHSRSLGINQIDTAYVVLSVM